MAEKFNATASQLWGAEVKDRQLQRSLIKGHKAPLAPFIVRALLHILFWRFLIFQYCSSMTRLKNFQSLP